jgi:membrane-associated phospholipid phosphatase
MSQAANQKPVRGPQDPGSPKEAAAEVLAGQPGPSARRWLGPLTLVVWLLFAIDTYFVASNPLLPFDIPITTWVQSVNWGPIAWVLNLINVTAGYPQGAVGVAAVILVFIWERRGGWLMAIGAIASLLDNEIKLMLARHRPTPDLVHILTPAPGYSYPSGHAVFFTWISFMLAFAIVPRIRPQVRWLPWVLAAIVIVLTCIARVWAGAHWPSDVIGGVLLALGWCSFVLWLPERWLPSPSWRWVRSRWGGARARPAA